MPDTTSSMNLSDVARAKAELDRAIEDGDAEKIARAAMINVWPLLTAHTGLLVSTVATLDERTLQRYPVLRIVHPITAVLARTPRPFKPQVYSEHARAMSAEEIDFVLLTQIIAYRASGDVDAALQYSQRLSDRIAEVRHESRDRLDGPRWYFHHQIASTYLAAGDTGRALQEFATTRQLGRLSAQSDAERAALGRIALAHAARGALSDAEHTLRAARSLPEPTPAQTTSSLSTEHVAAAMIAVERLAGDMDERLAELPPYDSIELTWPYALLAKTRTLIVRQQPDDAHEAIRLARGAHFIQPGSLAADVVQATTIEALLEADAIPQARRVVDEGTRAGILTRLAATRLTLREGSIGAAQRSVRRLAQDESLGPAQRAETALLSAWLELLRTGELDPQTEAHVERIVLRSDNRRLVSIMPQQLVDVVRAGLTSTRTGEFDAAIGERTRVGIELRPVLTPSELRVLRALADRRSTAETATAFHVSPNTIKSQLRSVYRKLGSTTREEALQAAERLHLFDQ